MAKAESYSDIVAELFFEQENPLISGAYKHGFLRTPLIVARALFSSRAGTPTQEFEFESGESVAIVFFENEYQAAARLQAVLSIDRIIRLDVKHMPIVRRILGVGGLLREIAYFSKQAVQRQGVRALSTLSMPLLGWLLFRTIEAMLEGRSGLRIITLNMQHPLSVGTFHGAKARQQRTIYAEHASTTLVAFKDRGYDLFVVDLPHTRALLEKTGVPPDRILLLREASTLKAAPISLPVRHIGLCINDLDSMESVLRVIDVLQELGTQVTLRVHDSDRRSKAFRDLATTRHLLFSSARDSRIESFFLTVDLVIAGNSNVLGDALRVNKPAIYFWEGTDDLFDYYGLAVHYTIPCARGTSDLRKLLTPVSVAP